jgi:hypothetical protein
MRIKLFQKELMFLEMKALYRWGINLKGIEMQCILMALNDLMMVQHKKLDLDR